MTDSFSIFGFDIPFWLVILSGSVTSFLITYISIPTIVNISKFKRLFDIPNERASHNGEVPVLGSLAIFAAFCIALTVFSFPFNADGIEYILCGVIVLFFLGLKDDILIIDPRKKILGQILASCIIVVFGGVRITDFHSVLGIGKIAYLPSVLFTVFFILTLINGFNLLDGVDGLASAAGMLSGLFTGVWFFLTDNFFPALTGFVIAGSLAAYFRFNVFGKRDKIFMGDAGSMITGFIISVLIVKFLEYSLSAEKPNAFGTPPAVAFNLLILPLFDTLRVIILRLANGKSPFRADKQHVHHLLLGLGFSHLKVTFILLGLNVVFLLLAILLQPVGSFWTIIISLAIAGILTVTLNMRLRHRVKTGGA